MKNLRVITALIWACGLLVAQPALAQKAKESKGIPVVARMELLQLTDSQMERLEGKDRLNKVEADKVLVSVDLLMTTGRDALAMLGLKNPIVYYDPRAQQFQIQYVDTGMKLDVVLRSQGVGLFEVEVRPEISLVQRPPDYQKVESSQLYPLTAAFITEEHLTEVKFGQTLILGRLTGPMARDFLTSLGQTETTNNVVCTLELEKPE